MMTTPNNGLYIADPGIVARISEVHPNVLTMVFDRSNNIWARTGDNGFNNIQQQQYPSTAGVDFLVFNPTSDNYYTCGATSALTYHRPSSRLGAIVTSVSACYGLAVGSEYVFVITNNQQRTVHLRSIDTGIEAIGTTAITIPDTYSSIYSIAAVKTFLYILTGSTVHIYNTQTQQRDSMWQTSTIVPTIGPRSFLVTFDDSVCFVTPPTNAVAPTTAPCYAVFTQTETVTSASQRAIFHILLLCVAGIVAIVL